MNIKSQYVDRIPALVAKIIADIKTPEIELWKYKLDKAYEHINEDDSYMFIFKKAVSEIFRIVDKDEYRHYLEELTPAEERLSNILDKLPTLGFSFSELRYLFPEYQYDSLNVYKSMQELYRSLLDAALLSGDKQTKRKLELIKQSYSGTVASCYLDLDTCSLRQMQNYIKQYMLLKGTSIYEEWLRYCKLVQVWRAYLWKYKVMDNTNSLLMSEAGYTSLVENDFIDVNAVTFLPAETVSNPGPNNKMIKECKAFKSFCDILSYLRSGDNHEKSYVLAVINTVGLGANLVANRDKVMRVLRLDSKNEKDECKKAMRAVLEEYASQMNDSAPYRRILCEGDLEHK